MQAPHELSMVGASARLQPYGKSDDARQDQRSPPEFSHRLISIRCSVVA